MNMIDTWLLTAVIFLAVILVAAEVFRGIRGNNKMRQQEAMMRRLQSDVHALCAGAINMGNYMSALEQKLRRLTERQDQLDLRDPMHQTYAHAIRLAQQGADVNDLVENCGLAQGEAELLLRVHRVQGRQTVPA
jgi:hypothetical protein